MLKPFKQRLATFPMSPISPSYPMGVGQDDCVEPEILSIFRYHDRTG